MKQANDNRSFGGRPRLPEGRARDQRVVTFLTPEERRRLAEFAEAERLSISAACHALILRGMASPQG